MRKTYLPNHKTFFSSLPGGTGALLIALVVLALRLASPELLWRLLAPVFGAGEAVSAQTRSVLDGFRNASELAERTEKLEREIAALSNQKEALARENADLRIILGDSPRKDGKASILAGVVARPPESPYDALVIAAGREEGVEVGQEAFGEADTPIGLVSSVLDHFSRVTLLSTPGLPTGGWAGPGKIAVTLIGTGGGTLRASAPRSAGISPGDTIYVPGPGMLPIGTVVRVDEDPSSSSATLRIRMFANLFSTSWVLLRDGGHVRLMPLIAATSTLQ
ncbi:rod shape-determining protein MreC [Candidatus Kaiserbacteria bacterium]|nr:rod shape-determining protein MreC [Candidatus Kaiserbacteria bacterium]